ncbi:MAG TPA: TIGR04283 family arsenosugar biosynthesis glycosyltransferase [Thermoanaerobaculia bacterium]|nr:TIGR04283 family arsenosugar biosynthesis glycosyltransferase [Thermoanaerobaculia bacterium]
MKLAIVVPTLNEEGTLRHNLPLAMEHADEVVVSDGGSTDRTVEVARALGAHVVSGPACRGGQLNRGATAAMATDADILLFLHADTVLPKGAGKAIREAVAAGSPGGAFLIRFDLDGFVYRLGGRVVNLRTKLAFTPLGDQAQFVTRDGFRELGGFREWPILEDLDFAKRMRRRWGRRRLAVLEDPVVTSSRRFDKQGPARTVALNWLIWLLFALGVSPHRLARLYRHVR